MAWLRPDRNFNHAIPAIAEDPSGPGDLLELEHVHQQRRQLDLQVPHESQQMPRRIIPPRESVATISRSPCLAARDSSRTQSFSRSAPRLGNDSPSTKLFPAVTTLSRLTRSAI